MCAGILIINMDLNFDSDPNKRDDFKNYEFLTQILNGVYSSASPRFYSTTGLILILYCFFSIILIPLKYLIKELVIKKLIILYDRKFTCDDTITRKKTNQQWAELFIGPDFQIEIRYLNNMTILYIGYMYFQGMPILIVLSFIYFFIMYWIDKWYLFRCCKMPDTLQSDAVHNINKKILYFLLLMHCFWSVFVFGENQIFQSSFSYINSNSDTDYTVSNMEKKNIFSKFIFLGHYSSQTQFQFYTFIVTGAIIVFVIIVYVFFYKSVWKISRYLYKTLILKNQKLKYSDLQQQQQMYPQQDLNQNRNLNKIKKTTLDSISQKLPFYMYLDEKSIIEEMNLTEMYYLRAQTPEYKQIVYNKLKTLEEWLNKISEINKQPYFQKEFVGLFSYNKIHNPKYLNMKQDYATEVYVIQNNISLKFIQYIYMFFSQINIYEY
ncbi:hypothetical protein PPERSA_07377 [Pseudocohnilembus persalinus]|uniref:CSC1/OSCA1-like cytosolic domain-containing protein n=1 Tax=Pseudocohnilembus persalinus TaxID=266149 RepID=A0A0V0Q9Q2_PSEPJ|nr:hypothetical protein PPERSA_07377 [Pseudocohnilembus persalinus]|eukprot:KRW98879.1 hypothetical protein PPERSA_07377 [Pseudocohnilembus persalinus]